MFNANCKANQNKAVRCSSELGNDQIFQSVIAIKVYNNDHTGPKIQLGGLKEGLLMVEYQPSMLLAVAYPPIPAAE